MLKQSQETELLASAARTTTTTSGDFPNNGYSGAWFYLNITANPGGAETLQVAIQAKSHKRGTYKTITAYPVCTAATNALFPHLIYPAAFHNSAHTTSHVWGTRLPPIYRVIVTHSASGSFTYSLDVQYLP